MFSRGGLLNEINRAARRALRRSGAVTDLRAAGPVPFDSTGLTIGQVLGFDGAKVLPVAPAGGFVMRGTYAGGTTYAAGDGVVASDGKVYVSLAAGNVGHDPTTDAGVHWVDLFKTAMLASVTNTMTKAQILAITQRTRENRCLFPRPGLGSTAAVSKSPTANTLTWPAPPITDGPATDPFGGTGAGSKVQLLTVVPAGPADVSTFPASSSWRSVARGGELVTNSRYVYQPSRAGAQPARLCRFNFRWYDAAGVLIRQDQTTNAPIGAQDAWVRVSASERAPEGAVALDIAFYFVAAVAGDLLYSDGILTEVSKGVVNAYGDGATASWGWGGTAYRTESHTPATSDRVFFSFRDATGLTVYAHIAEDGKAYFRGLDAQEERISGVADPVNPLDAVNLQTLQAFPGQFTLTYITDPILGDQLIDVKDKNSVNIMSLRDNAEHRQKTVSEGVFDDLWVPDGKVVVVCGLDDIPDVDLINAWPVIRALSIPFSFATVAGWIGLANRLTWTDLQDLRDYGGAEIVCHSRNHATWVDNKIFSELLDSAAIIAAGPGGTGAPQFYVDSFTQPGVWTGAVEGNMQAPANVDPPAHMGYLLRSRFSVATAYVVDTPSDYAVTPIPVRRRFGATRRVDFNSLTVATLTPIINAALAKGSAIVSIKGHSAQISPPMDWTEFANVLTYLAGLRDQGIVEFRTTCAGFHSKPSGSIPRRNLTPDGDFHMDTPGTIGSGGALKGWGYNGTPAVVASGAQVGTDPIPASGSVILDSATDEISTEFAAGIRTLEIEFDARTKNGGAPSGTELRIQAVPLTYSALRTVEIATGGSTGPQWPTLTAAWQHFRCCIGFDPQADNGYKVLAKLVSGADGVELANVKMFKA